MGTANGPHIRRRRHRQISWLCPLLLLLLGSCQTIDLTDHVWRELQTRHFTIISNSQPEHVIGLAEDLERFRALASNVLEIEPFEDPVPVKVFLFGDFGSFAQFTGGGNIIGYMWPTLRAHYIVVGPGLYYRDQRSIVFHEYVHYLLRNQPGRIIPTWYDEGLAQMLSRVEDRGDHWRLGSLSRNNIASNARSARTSITDNRWQVDLVSREPVYALAKSWSLPLATLVAEDNVLTLAPGTQLLFYAQSWAAVHMFKVGHQAGYPNRANALDDYLAALDTGTDRETAFKQAFAISDEKQFSKEMRRYLSKRRLPGYLIPKTSIATEPVGSPTVMNRDQAATELGRLMLLHGTERAELAADLFNKALQTHPENSNARAGLATVFDRQSLSERANEQALQALASEPNNANAMLDLGNMYLRECAFSVERYRTDECRATLTEAESLYRKIIAIDPRIPEGHVGLAISLSRLGKNAQEAISHLQIAQQTSSWIAVVNLELGRLYMKTGRFHDALHSLTRVVQWARNGDLKADAAHAMNQLRMAMDENTVPPTNRANSSEADDPGPAQSSSERSGS